MRHIISYVSTARKGLLDSDIEDLMNYIKLRNDFLDITGILIYSEGNFFQILEGQKDVISLVFEKIKRDTRHYNIIKMLDKEINRKTFSEFNFSYTVISNRQSQEQLKQFLKKEKNTNPEHFKSISYLAMKFMKIL